ncbi:DUF2800 domain-containing protein [Chordicoccus furentiruminis]|uniref:DUF2800 domain-containing protein n=1 Tax=Chordicoccus furentiruminis TaxID=2709410 RepID=UPI0023A7F467|nr:DUF2800 domain-containing protein [Chordicoccus furentiruminis]
MPKHAYLSASASHRWLACPPSAKLCAQEEDRGSPYAQQGTDAHELCQYLLEKALGMPCRDPVEDLTYYDAEMQEAAESYAAFVMEQVAEAKKLCKDPLVCVEQTLDFSKWVEHGFGTGDAVIVADDLLHIIDFKFGVGVLVEATDNSQLKCYALGAVDTFGDLYDIRRIRLSIFQPRRENVDTFELTKDELLKWADEVLAPIAKLAYEGGGEFHAGDHCQFCKVKASCRKRAEYAMELAQYDFADAPTLDETEIAAILPQIDTLVSWAEDIKAYALNQALSGVRYPGYKLVEGRSNRRYTDEAAVAQIVSDAGYDPYEKKLLGITAMTRQLGKKRFEELLRGLVVKPQGKPVLAPNTDKRPEFNAAANDFMEEYDYE